MLNVGRYPETATVTETDPWVSPMCRTAWPTVVLGRGKTALYK